MECWTVVICDPFRSPSSSFSYSGGWLSKLRPILTELLSNWTRLHLCGSVGRRRGCPRVSQLPQRRPGASRPLPCQKLHPDQNASSSRGCGASASDPGGGRELRSSPSAQDGAHFVFAKLCCRVSVVVAYKSYVSSCVRNETPDGVCVALPQDLQGKWVWGRPRVRPHVRTGESPSAAGRPSSSSRFLPWWSPLRLRALAGR